MKVFPLPEKVVDRLDDFVQANLGQVEVGQSGELILTLQPVRDAWTGMELGMLTLIKQ